MTATPLQPQNQEAKREAEARQRELNDKMRAIKAEIGKIQAGAVRAVASW